MADAAPLKAFFNSTYDEAVALLIDLREFVSVHMVNADNGDDPELPAELRVLMVHEVTRTTRRMTNVMAWLMLQKAVAAGEMKPEEAESHEAAHLGEDDDSSESLSKDSLGDLPVALRSLIDRTRRIYDKAIRLKGHGFS